MPTDPTQDPEFRMPRIRPVDEDILQSINDRGWVWESDRSLVAALRLAAARVEEREDEHEE